MKLKPKKSTTTDTCLAHRHMESTEMYRGPFAVPYFPNHPLPKNKPSARLNNTELILTPPYYPLPVDSLKPFPYIRATQDQGL